EAGNTLEGEGRGLSAFREKWAYAMRQWDTKVAAAAKQESAPPAGNDDSFTVRHDAADPVDLWSKLSPPSLPTGLLPRQIEAFAFGETEHMGVDTAVIAMAELTGYSFDFLVLVDIKVNPNRPSHDNTHPGFIRIVKKSS